MQHAACGMQHAACIVKLCNRNANEGAAYLVLQVSESGFGAPAFTISITSELFCAELLVRVIYSTINYTHAVGRIRIPVFGYVQTTQKRSQLLTL